MTEPGWRYVGNSDKVEASLQPEEPQRVLLPRLGAHLSIWGSGHSCRSDGPHDQCICECGMTAPWEMVSGDQ